MKMSSKIVMGLALAFGTIIVSSAEASISTDRCNVEDIVAIEKNIHCEIDLESSYKICFLTSRAFIPPRPAKESRDDRQKKVDNCLAFLEKSAELNRQLANEVDDSAKKEVATKIRDRDKQRLSLVSDARSAAIGLLKSSDTPNKNVLRLLSMIAVSEHANDSYVNALNLAQMLINSGGNSPEMNAVAGKSAFALSQYETAKPYLKRADEAGLLKGRDLEYFESIERSQKEYIDELAKRDSESKADDLPRVKLTLDVGVIILELYENEAPDTVGNFVSLVDQGYYNGVGFHRVLGNFMAQGGGGERTGYRIYCECHKSDYRRHYRGTISMAHAGLNTGSSQFFLTFRPTPHLDGIHTAFGRIIEGMDVLERIRRVQPGTPKEEQSRIILATVIRKRDHDYAPKKVTQKSD